jgi:hypothetical protein
MFTLIESLNTSVAEALERRAPIMKASVSDPSQPSAYAKAIDVQHLPQKDTAFIAKRLITQLLSQFKSKFDFQFESKEDGIFNNLLIKATTQSAKPKLIQIEISQLTTDDIESIKKAFYSY